MFYKLKQMFNKVIFEEYLVDLYTVLLFIHSFTQKIVHNFVFIHTESHFIHRFIHIYKKMWINLSHAIDKMTIIYYVCYTVYNVLCFFII